MQFPQTVYEQLVPRGNSNILLAIESIGNRRRGNCAADARFPKQLTSPRVQGVKIALGRGEPLTREGIYYHPEQSPTEVHLFSFASGTSHLIFNSGKRSSPGLSVSPDGHWLLFGVVDRNSGSDLMLVENFH